MKSYTDLEQSKKLADILPLESADMYFIGHQSIINPKEWEYGDTPKVRGKYIAFDDKRIFCPCWSLSALLGVLPQSVRLVGTPKDSYWYCECVNGNNQWYAGFGSADNPIDACYEMILKLHEEKIL
jgi:hypothetical protein